MLDREEERRLAEIEARLRVEDPELHELFARAPAIGHGPIARPSARPPRREDLVDPPETGDAHTPDPTDRPEPPASDGIWVEPDPQDGPRHPSHLPRRRWDDDPAFDAELAPAPSLLGSILRTCVAVIAAVALTTVVTLTLGPDVGGFVSVVAFCLVGMYGYQTLRGCPGMRRARGQG